MEEHGYKYIHKFSQFVKKLNSTKTLRINKIPNKVKNSDFMSFCYGQPIRETTPANFTMGDEV